MLTLTKRFLKIYSGEGSKLLSFFLVALILQAGVAIGLSLSDSLFLSRVGVNSLPYVFIIMPIFMIIFIPFYTSLISRFGISKVFYITTLTLIIFSILIYITLQFTSGIQENPILYYFIKIHAFIWMLALYSLFWNFVDEYFIILDAKRLYPVLSGGIAVGAAVGGALVSNLTNIIGIAHLFLLWAFLYIFIFPLLILIHKKWKKIEYASLPQKNNILTETKVVYTNLKKSSYIRFIFISLFLIYFLTTLCEFQYLTIFSSQGNEDELAIIFGKLFFWANIFNLLVNFFIFNRLVSRIGVRKITMIQPVVYFITFFLLLFYDNFWAGAFAFFSYQGVLLSIDANNYNFIFNAIPQESKKQTRTFAEGIIDPLGTSAAGIILLVLAKKITFTQLSFFGIATSLLFILSAALLSYKYKDAMLELIKSGWLDFTKKTGDLVNRLSLENIHNIYDRYKTDKKNFLVHYYNEIEIENSINIAPGLLALFNDTTRDQQFMLKSILNSLILKEDFAIIQYLLNWQKQQQNIPIGIQEILATNSLLDYSPDSIQQKVEDVIRAITLINSIYIDDNEEALSIIKNFLNGNDNDVAFGIKALGYSNQERYLQIIISYITSTNPVIKNETLEALYNLSTTESSRIINSLISILPECDTNAQIIIIKILYKIHDSAAIPPLLNLIPFLSPKVKREVEKFIFDIGVNAIPILVTSLQTEKYHYLSRSLSARTLSRISFPQFENKFPKIIINEIDKAYSYLYSYWRLGVGTVSAENSILLKRFYKGKLQRALDFILELLTIGGRLTNYNLIASALRSPNPKIRANTLETIQLGINHKIYKRLLPLIDSRSLNEKIEYYQNHYKQNNMNDRAIILQAAECDDENESLAALYALAYFDTESLLRITNDKVSFDKSLFYRTTLIDILSKNSESHIEKTALFAKYSPFSFLNFEELFAVSEVASVISSETFTIENNFTPEYFLLIIEGSISYLSKNYNRGDILFFHESLSQKYVSSKVKYKKFKALVIYRNDLQKMVSIYPRIGFQFMTTAVGANETAN